MAALIARHAMHSEPYVAARMWQIAVQEGWFVGLRPGMGTVLASGVILTEDERQTKTLLLNDCLSEAWQRYAIAHELAHEILGHRSVFALRAGAVESRQEDEADDAAALVLVPECLLHLDMGEITRRCVVPVGVVQRRLSLAGVERDERLGETCVGSVLRPC